MSISGLISKSLQNAARQIHKMSTPAAKLVLGPKYQEILKLASGKGRMAAVADGAMVSIFS